MKRNTVKQITTLALLSALAFALMLVEFSLPIIPSFVKLDFSEVPALIAAFLFGPVQGVLVCLFKNLIHLTVTSTGGVGELANFLLGASFAGAAGLVYRLRHTFSGALIACASGSLAMALVGFPVNLFITYPFYARLFIPMEAIIGMYKALLPAADTLEKALLIFNTPFNFVKGLLVSLVVLACYKRLSNLYKMVGRQESPVEL